MSISSIGASALPTMAVAASSESGEAPGPDSSKGQDAGNGAASLPPVQAATAPGTGQKVDVMA